MEGRLRTQSREDPGPEPGDGPEDPPGQRGDREDEPEARDERKERGEEVVRPEDSLEERSDPREDRELHLDVAGPRAAPVDLGPEEAESVPAEVAGDAQHVRLAPPENEGVGRREDVPARARRASTNRTGACRRAGGARGVSPLSRIRALSQREVRRRIAVIWPATMPSVGPREIPRSVPVVAVTRGGRVESVHRGSIAVVAEDGTLLAWAGDPRQPTWLRSSAKPFQLIPFLASGGEERFDLSTEEIALAAASHSGEPAHARLAAALLAKGGFTEADLHCGAHPPMHEPSARALYAAGGTPSPLHNNCSGKHAAMLLASRLLGLDPSTYWSKAHPLQRRILASVSRMTGVPAARIPRAVDGCSVPVFRVPLASLARGYARLVGTGPRGETAAEASARRRIAEAMAGAPEMVAGTGRFTTDLMRTFGGSSLVAKEGAEGVYAVGVPAALAGGKALGIAVKIADGAERGRDAVTVETLRALGLARGARLGRLRKLAFRPVLNVRGDVVGGLETLFSLERA